MNNERRGRISEERRGVKKMRSYSSEGEEEKRQNEKKKEMKHEMI